MDSVNSFTTNNRNVTMENIADGENGEQGDNSGKRDMQNSARADEQQHDIMPTGMASQSGSASAEQKVQAVVKDRSQVPDYLKRIGMDPRQFWPKKYRFTREKSPGQHNPLSISQRNFYESNGYIILDDCVSQKLLNAIRAQKQESSLVNEFLMDKLLVKNGKLLQYVKCFCDERVMLMTHQLVESFQSSNQVKAVIDNEQQQRQHLFRDWLYLPFRPIDKVVCVITAIEALDHVILLVPGTHRVGQCSISSTLESINSTYEASQESSHQLMARELFECAPEKLSSLVEKSKKGFKYVNLKPGQTLFYHPGLVHGFSDDLVNFNKRQLASLAYYAAADCEYIDFRKSSGLMENKMPLPINLSHFRGSNPCDYTSWIDKPKLIQDSKSNL